MDETEYIYCKYKNKFNWAHLSIIIIMLFFILDLKIITYIWKFYKIQ